MLIELGEAPGLALQRVRMVRPGAEETRAQEGYVLGYERRAKGIRTGLGGRTET